MTRSELYWQKRLQDFTNKINVATNKQLQEAFQSTAKSIIKEMELLYRKLIEIESGQSKESLIANMYKSKEYYETLQQINERLRKLGITQYETISPGLKSVYKHSSQIIMERYGLDIPKSILNLDDDDYLLKQINRVWCTDGKTWSDRIWNTSDTSQLGLLKQRLSEVLVESLTTGKLPKDFVKSIQEEFNVSAHRASTLVRTELNMQQRLASVDRYKDAGVEQVRWVNTDKRTVIKYVGKHLVTYEVPCEECEKLAQEGPYNINDIPYSHPNCLCKIEPITSLK